MTLVPIVVEREGAHERSYDIYSRLMKDRVIVLSDTVNNATASVIIASMLFLDFSSKRDIQFYINSPGGTVTDGLAIYDTMKALRSDVSTICIGQACSMGSFLLAGGTKGKRYALPNSRVMMHQVSGGTHGALADMKTSFEEAERLNEILAEIIAKNTGQTLKKYKADINRDFFMSAKEAKAYGVIDEIIEKIPYNDKGEK